MQKNLLISVGLIITFGGLNARPHFMGLIYLVISMKEKVTHEGSRNSSSGRRLSRAVLRPEELEILPCTPARRFPKLGKCSAALRDGFQHLESALQLSEMISST